MYIHGETQYIKDGERECLEVISKDTLVCRPAIAAIAAAAIAMMVMLRH